MGEICKDPRNAAQSNTIESTEKILRFLIEAEGAARTVRLLQYAFEDLAKAEETNNPTKKGEPAPHIASAAKYLKCSDALDAAYEIIKNEIRL